MNFIQNSMDILLVGGAFALIMLGVFFAVLAFRLGGVLRNVGNLTSRVDRVTESVENVMYGPLEFVEELISNFIKKLK